MSKKTETIDIVEIRRERIPVCIVGETPLICNRMTEKAKQEFLLPGKTKNRAERESSLKQDPYEAFRNSPYTQPSGNTLITMPSTAFKGALRQVAVDMPGATKAQLGRLTFVEGEQVEIFGVPKLLLSTVRNSGMNRTPDIRARAILPEWAALLYIHYTVPMLSKSSVLNLFAAAGSIVGVGDWRPEKGSGNFGCFEICAPDDSQYKSIVESSGREVQEAAMKRAEPYNAETEELLNWFGETADARGFKIAK